MSTKKTMAIALLFIFACTGAFAQNKNVRKAKKALQKGDLKEAVNWIKPATTDEKTGEKAETWYVMGNIYSKLAHKDSLNEKGEAYRDTAYAAYKKTLKIDPKYNAMLISSYLPLRQLYRRYWAYGVNGFNNNDYKASFHAFKKVNDEINFTKDFELSVLPDDIDTMVLLNIGNAAYRAEMKDSAVRYYQKVVDMGYDKESFVYKILLQQYRDSDEDKFFSILEKGKKLFPDDKDFSQIAINYYKMHDEVDKLVDNLEEEVKANPDDYDKVFNLAHAYDNLANKDRDSSATGPDQRPEYLKKAVKYYNQALKIQPESYGASFNLGLLYYNQAAHIEQKMNNLTDEQRKAGVADSLTNQEEKVLNEAFPHLKKAYDILDAKSTLDENELAAYKNAIHGLEGIYARRDESDKYDELEKKLDAADSKLEK